MSAIFIIYLFIFLWLITKIRFFNNSGLPNKWLIILFLSKIISGYIYGWFYSRLPLENADTWRYYILSKDETNVLLSHPLNFVKDFFTYGYSNTGNLFSGKDSYWNDIKSDAVIKLMAVFNVFTFKNYYANLIFFNFFFFFGPVALFRLMINYYVGKKWLLVTSIFFVPSFLFWCSGAHKDGFLFSALALSVYFFNKQLQQKAINFRYWIVILFCFIILFMLRNFLLFLLLPAFFCWWFTARKPALKWQVFISVYSIGIILFFIIPLFYSSLNFPQYIVTKQNEFKALSGNSVIHIPGLLPDAKSFLYFLPFAFDIAFLRPHLFESLNPTYIISALENIFILLLIIFSILLRDKKCRINSYFVFILFFCISELLLSGYTVTFSGSIMRYKSILLPFETSAFISLINYNFLFKKKL